jgi:hypothetical protein
MLLANYVFYFICHNFVYLGSTPDNTSVLLINLNFGNGSETISA